MTHLPTHITTLLSCLILADAAAATAFTPERGDHICIIGNTLAERMQHDGYLEASLHARFPAHKLAIRNLAFSGDEIGIRLRSMNFGSPDEWLAGRGEPIGGHKDNRFELAGTKADVIFAFFGRNESSAGEAGLGKFERELDGWIRHTLSQSYNGEGPPRLVLFSPIAHENLGNPHLPDGSEHNRLLALYTRAMAQVAGRHPVTFVDLFEPSRRLYEESDQPLTINGVHLNRAGNHRIAEVIDEALFGPPLKRDPAHFEKIRRAVLDKNFHWFERYRASDGYSTYGSRAFLTFHRSSTRHLDKNSEKVDEAGLLPTNYEVLQRELRVLDVMTANREKRVWAVAEGRDEGVDDSNLPPFIDAQTNIPGPRPDGVHEFLDGEEAIAQMQLHEGLVIELFACEKRFPELVNPVQMEFDARGRLWVAVWPQYPHWKPGTPMIDKLLVFEDADGDGRADHMTVFADGLHNPTGFAFHDGGVLIAQAPDLWFLRDTDGDGRADHRERMLHGFDTADTHCNIAGFRYDGGGGLHLVEGTFHHTQVETPWGAPVRSANAAVYRLEPRAWKLEVVGPFPFPNTHGQTFDQWGVHVVMDATMGRPIPGAPISIHKRFPDKLASSVPTIWKQRYRPVTGAEFVSSRHFPESMQGDLLVQNVIGFRGVMRYRPAPDGASLGAEEKEPLLSSRDEKFRPVDMRIGPDGALYLLDWHNPIIGHMQHNLRDTSRDRSHGRIYRTRWANRPLIKPVKIHGEPVGQLLDLLREPENNVRTRVKIELAERDSAEVTAALKAWVAALDEGDPAHHHHLTEALWVHQWHNVLNEPLLLRQLESNEPKARAAAVRVLRRWRDRLSHDPVDLLRRAATDAHPAVRLDAVAALSDAEPAGAATALEIVHEARAMGEDRFLAYALREAVKTLEAAAAIHEGSTHGSAEDTPWVTYEGREGPGKGKHIVFVTGDEEYRSEESGPMLAKILAVRHGFRCTVLFAIEPGTGCIHPWQHDNIPGLHLLEDADAMVISTRFRDLPDAQMRHLARFVESGKSIIGIRPVVAGFRISEDRKSAYADWDFRRDDGGFGGRVLGMTWWRHHGKHGQQGTRAIIHQPHAGHPILRGVRDVWGPTDVYGVRNLPPDATILMHGQVLAGMKPDDPPVAGDVNDPMMPLAWTRELKGPGGRVSRIFYTSIGASVDFKSEDLRRLLVNACYWATRLENAIDAAADVRHVGDYQPTWYSLKPRPPLPIRPADLRLPSDPTGQGGHGTAPVGRKIDLTDREIAQLTIHTVPHRMNYDVAEFTVRSGQRVELTLHNPDAMPHNLLIAAPGTADDIAAKALKMGADGFANHFVPRDSHVLHATRMLNQNERQTLTFDAPAKQGEYPFVCTFPGHAQLMRGIMKVTP